MKKAKTGDTVKVSYVGTLDNGTVFDQSKENEHLEFTIGNEQVIPGFNNAILDMGLGETKTVTIPANEAYGEYNEGNIGSIRRKDLPEEMKPKVGQQYELCGEKNERIMVIVTKVTDTEITIDANHPLAGKDLTFKITLEDIQ